MSAAVAVEAEPHVAGAAPQLVNWPLAERVARSLAGAGSGKRSVRQGDIDRAAAGTVELVCEYTGLEPAGKAPVAELVSRPEWIRSSLDSLRVMSSGFERRLAESLGFPGPLGVTARGFAGMATGIELGLATGFLAQRVLGQYDVSLVGPARPARLLFVAPNLAEAQRKLGGERRIFLRWIALHEATHAVQFAAVPWLREHIGTLLKRLLDGAELRIEMPSVRRLAAGLFPPDPRRLARSWEGGELASLLLAPERRRLVRDLQATMAVVEGYSEHVMDAVGDRLDPGYARLRDRLDEQRDRRRGALEAIVARLLGLDLKMRQYRLGKSFADAVHDRAGIDGLNRVWEAPESLPRPSELERPGRWLARTGL